MNNGILDKIRELLSRLEARSLSNTKPFLITSSTGNLYDVDAYALKAVGNDVTFNTLVVDNADGRSDDFSTITVLSGDTVYLNVSQIDVNSGELIVYQR